MNVRSYGIRTAAKADIRLNRCQVIEISALDSAALGG